MGGRWRGSSCLLPTPSLGRTVMPSHRRQDERCIYISGCYVVDVIAVFPHHSTNISPSPDTLVSHPCNPTISPHRIHIWTIICPANHQWNKGILLALLPLHLIFPLSAFVVSTLGPLCFSPRGWTTYSPTTHTGKSWASDRHMMILSILLRCLVALPAPAWLSSTIPLWHMREGTGR